MTAHPFYLVAEPSDLEEERFGSELDWEEGAIVLAPSPEAAVAPTSGELLDRRPRCVDPFGCWAEPSPDGRRVLVHLPFEAARPRPLELADGRALELPPGDVVADLVIGGDLVLLVAVRRGDPGGRQGYLLQVDLRRRFATRVEEPLVLEGFVPTWLAPSPWGAWAYDEGGEEPRLVRVMGQPLVTDLAERRRCTGFSAHRRNPDPPRIEEVPLPAGAPRGVVAMAPTPGGSFGLLASGGRALALWTGVAFEVEDLDEGLAPAGLAFPEERLVALAPTGRHGGVEQDSPLAVVRRLGSGPEGAEGRRYPLRFYDGRGLVAGVGGKTYYGRLSFDGALLPPAPLRRAPSRARRAEGSFEVGPLDAGEAGVLWDRLYVEASIPEGCSVLFHACASDRAEPPAAGAWEEMPRPAWLSEPSELPFHPGLLPSAPGRSGLFTSLLQRPETLVRQVRGRYLWLRAILGGDGVRTPAVAAVRVLYPRRAWQELHLPALYHERVGDADGAAPSSRSTGADFLGRLLALFEGMHDRLDRRIGEARVLADPEAAPAEWLPWIASWLGLVLEPSWTEAQRRAFLADLPLLYRRRGTMDGLRHALDIALEGAVSRREVVVVEHFRLRRTFSTILGVDLADEADPMTGCYTVSGNSSVGGSFFLGVAGRRELYALFADDVVEAIAGKEGQEVRDELFARHAHRYTVLVGGADLDEERLATVRRVVATQGPAHAIPRVARATRAFVLAAGDLLGVHTTPAAEPGLEPFVLGSAQVSVRGTVLNPAALDLAAVSAASPSSVLGIGAQGGEER